MDVWICPLKFCSYPENLMEVQASSATLKGCLGLVKGQKTFGLRFR